MTFTEKLMACLAFGVICFVAWADGIAGAALVLACTTVSVLLLEAAQRLGARLEQAKKPEPEPRPVVRTLALMLGPAEGVAFREGEYPCRLTQFTRDTCTAAIYIARNRVGWKFLAITQVGLEILVVAECPESDKDWDWGAATERIARNVEAERLATMANDLIAKREVGKCGTVGGDHSDLAKLAARLNPNKEAHRA